MTKKTMVIVSFLILLQLLVAIYLPINNIVEYSDSEPDQLSLHFYIVTFLAVAFYILFGLPFWKALSPTGRKFSIIASIGWMIDLYLICTNHFLNGIHSYEPYVIGSMLVIGPCLVLFFDFLIRKAKASGKELEKG